MYQVLCSHVSGNVTETFNMGHKVASIIPLPWFALKLNPREVPLCVLQGAMTCDGRNPNLVTTWTTAEDYTQLTQPSKSTHIYLQFCMHDHFLPPSTAPGQWTVPRRACPGASFCHRDIARGGQRAGPAHIGPWPSVFLMALSHFIIDFNSAMPREEGETRPSWSDDRPSGGTWRESKSSGTDQRQERVESEEPPPTSSFELIRP